ncbi:MAG TPA: adenylate/guanylate cyclase domain-containing protein [Kofleriaceae bacterium]|nr:adenylate/guanylate cyclase domain-containing protein [Kofleriaceae bacterium]
MRLRRKLTLAFFLVSALVSLVLALFLYRFVDRSLRGELRARLRDVAYLGAQTIDHGAYERLRAVAAGSDAAAMSAAEQSSDYRTISDQLAIIRNAEPGLVRYAYLMIPTADPAVARFVVDADVLALEAAHSDEEISHLGEPYDLAKLPELREALAACVPAVEHGLSYDASVHLYSVSAFYPLGGTAGDCHGVLGVDITDQGQRRALHRAGSLALEVSLAVIVLALLASVGMGSLLTRPVVSLSATVRRFADKDFAARTKVHSRDEIGQLAENFNEMATEIEAHHEHLEQLVEQRTRELLEEKQTSERLLLNVLPGPIAERLKHDDGVIVDRFDQVTVLFADIVGFTKLSARTSPEALVTMLDELFTRFDRLAERHRLEKIKTIGDCYMAVAGIPTALADHAAVMAQMGLDMLAAVADYAKATGVDLAIRVGVHSGSVVAGVIGRKKFIYDLWGDTVNTASRMESHGVPGRVHLTEATAVLLGEAFEVEPRGTIDIKGKGPMMTFLLVGRRRRTSEITAAASPATTG